MCGICGQFNFKDGKPVEAERIHAMMRSIAHRGPDDEGEYLDKELGLGFRRLSIIDLSAGHQPMSDAEESVWVVFNGEIYNFQELRDELEAKGHVFRTRSDTEVLVHGYKQWGDALLDRLNGMFGFAIWDVKKRRLLIARDRAGIKMIYYRIRDGQLFFGSEVRPVLIGTGERAEPDPLGLNLFLRYRYTPSPRTVFKNIEKLAPGCCLIVENGEARVRRYWNYKPEPFDPMPSDAEAGEKLLELYKQAVRRQLISDVPLGLLLSGGLDSGLLCALMGLEGSGRKTFTVGYGAEEYRDDEMDEAASTARALDAENYQTKISRKEFQEMLPRIIRILEEPVASSSVVPMYYVCGRAREDVTVALVGQGPDEMFAGYTRHLGLRYGDQWRSVPEPLRDFLAASAGLLPRNETLKRGLYSLGETDRMRRYQQVFSIMPAETIDGLFQDGLLPDNPGDRIQECWSGLPPLLENMDELGGFNFLEIRSSLPDELLMYADKISMAHGLEGRVPFLDHDIIEYVERLSASFKIRGRQRKWLHRKVCRDFLPDSVIRARKRGFGVNVVDDWFRESLLGKLDDALMSDESLLFQYLKPDAVRKLVRDHQSGRADNHKLLFSLIVFEEWMRIYEKGSGELPESA